MLASIAACNSASSLQKSAREAVKHPSAQKTRLHRRPLLTKILNRYRPPVPGLAGEPTDHVGKSHTTVRRWDHYCSLLLCLLALPKYFHEREHQCSAHKRAHTHTPLLEVTSCMLTLRAVRKDTQHARTAHTHLSSGVISCMLASSAAFIWSSDVMAASCDGLCCSGAAAAVDVWEENPDALDPVLGPAANGSSVLLGPAAAKGSSWPVEGGAPKGSSAAPNGSAVVYRTAR